MSWEQMEAASLAAEREEFRRTTPGQRVERMLDYMQQTASLASRGRRRKRDP